MPTASTDFRGIALPAVRSAGSYFSVRNKYDTAWGDLISAVLTPIGGRPMKRSYGSGLNLAIFELMDPSLAGLIQNYVYTSVANHAPHVSVRKVEVSMNGKNVSVRISFGLANDPTEQQTRAFLLDRSTVVKVLSVSQQ